MAATSKAKGPRGLAQDRRVDNASPAPDASAVKLAHTAQVQSRMMTLEEVAKYLRVHPTTIYRLLRKHRIPAAFRVGGDWRFDLSSIDRWISEQEQTMTRTAKRQN